MYPTRKLRPLLAVPFLCLLAAEVTAQPAANKNKAHPNDARRAEQELRINNLIALGGAAPPEVKADLLLTLASSQLITSKAAKKELLEDAFRVAGNAREPVRRRGWSLNVDTRSGLTQAAFELERDRLSLQSKAVMQMIPLDQELVTV